MTQPWHDCFGSTSKKVNFFKSYSQEMAFTGKQIAERVASKANAPRVPMLSTAANLMQSFDTWNDESLFNQHIQALAPELFTTIYDYVFPTRPNIEADILIIDETYRPPSYLSVDRCTRQKHLKSYYATTTFVFSNAELGQRWLESLTEDNREVLQDVYYAAKHDVHWTRALVKMKIP